MGDTPQTAESYEQAGRGHWTIPRPGDLRIEAWGPTREDCLAETVLGLVNSFAVVAGRPLHGRAERHMTARSDEGLLVGVVDEVVYWLKAGGDIPASIAVRRALDGGVVMVLLLVRAADADIVGPTPKAATWHDLRCAPDPAGRWTCAVTVDV